MTLEDDIPACRRVLEDIGRGHDGGLIGTPKGRLKAHVLKWKSAGAKAAGDTAITLGGVGYPPAEGVPAGMPRQGPSSA
jgi:hypothetical protein